MNKIKYILLFALSAMILFSCEQKDHLFSEDMSCVGFYGETASVLEVDKAMSGKDTVTVQLLVTTLPGAPSVNIELEVDVEGIDNPAVEGVDFEIVSGKTITVSAGSGYAPVKIAAIDNDKYDKNGNKSFKLKVISNSKDYDLSSESVMTITVVDDDHPLGWLFGDYDVAVTETSNGNTAHPGKIGPVEGEVDKVKIYGMSGTKYGAPLTDPYFILASIDDVYSMLTIKAGQEWDSWNWGPVEMQVWEDDNGEGEQVDEMTGVISTDGGVTVTFSQQYTFYITDGNNVGLGLQWAWNSDAEANSPVSVWTRK